MIDYEKILNKEQYEAVITTEGPVLVQAGAGTGKTCTLVHRVAYLIEQGIRPESILLLTFTRKAAEEMLTRAEQLLDDRCARVIGGTYHSFALNQMKQHLGFMTSGEKFTILSDIDDQEAFNIARDIWLEQENIDEETAKVIPDAAAFKRFISLQVNTTQPMEIVVRRELGMEEEGYAGDLAYRIIDGAKKIKALAADFRFTHHLYNFDDLLEIFREQLETNTSFREAVTAGNRYIMVDEYQDNNKLQAAILQLLCARHQNILIVGDAMQSIYGFRGANAKSMNDFRFSFPAAKIIKLHQNYRSVQNVLDFSNGIMQGIPEDLYNPLHSDKGAGSTVDVALVDGDIEETDYILNSIDRHLRAGGSYKDIAVLIRSGIMSNNLELRLRGQGIPFVKVGGKSIIELAHTQDVLALCRVLVNPLDIIAWNRVLKLMDGLGPATANKLAGLCTGLRYGFLKNLGKIRNKTRIEPQLSALYDLLMDLQIQPFETQIKRIISYYIPLCKRNYAKDSMDINKRLYQLKDIERDALRYAAIEEYLESYMLSPQSVSDGADKNVVTISTVHSAKGLEWKKVFVLRVIDGAFPSRNGDDAEERRLFYVAVTRARETLTLFTYGLPGYTRSSYINACEGLPIRYVDAHGCEIDNEPMMVG